jgi:hypothetical protein
LTWKLWYDDCRPPPDDTWVWARTNERAKELLTQYVFDECSLDHDMGLHELTPDEANDWDKIVEIANALQPEVEENGVALVKWMIETERVPELVVIHSWNPEGASRMASWLTQAGYDCYIAPFKPPKR